MHGSVTTWQLLVQQGMERKACGVVCLIERGLQFCSYRMQQVRLQVACLQ